MDLAKNKQKIKIPEGWKVVKIRDLLEFERPDAYFVKNTSYTESGKTPVLTANKSFVLGYTDEDFGICNNVPVIIFDDFTTDCKYVNFSFKVKSSAIKILRCRDNDANLKYIYEIMKTIKFPVGNHKRYYISQYQDLDILLPPLSIQNKIVEILRTVDEEIEKVEMVIEKTEKTKNGLMKELFRRGIKHLEFKQTKIGNIPKEWELKTFGEFATLQRGFDLPIQERISGKYALITSNGITDTHSEFKVKAPGVVTGRSGTLGNVFYIEKDFWPLNTTLYIKDFHGNNEKFVYYKIQFFGLEKFGTGTGVPTLNRNTVHKEFVAVPKYNEQEKIAEILSVVDNKISIYKKIKNNLIQLKKGLMADLLSGKKVLI